MPVSILIARLLHIVLGVFWVGAILFNTWFLMPAMQEAGPDAAKVNAALMRRGFMKIMPIVALVTIVSGFWLFWKMSFGFSADYMRSGHGMTYGIGGSAAVLGFLIGISVMRPAMMKAVALSQRAASVSESERATLVTQAAGLRARGALASKIVALLLVLSTMAMALGRYIA